MAASSTPSRRPDGKPETAKDSRFFDLRQSGYDGPIDQDGRAVEEVRDESGRVSYERSGR